MKRALTVAAGSVALLAGTSATAAAHPLGNFTVNSFSALRVQPNRVLVDHVTDSAEIPTAQLANASDPISKTAPPTRQHAWSLRRCGDVASKLTLAVAGRRIPLTVDEAALRFPPGAGGLATSRLTCRLSGGPVTIRSDAHVSYRDDSDDGRVGWHEIIALGDDTSLKQSDVPSRSVSQALTAYPVDLLSSPLSVTSADLLASPGGAAAADPLAGTDAASGKEQRRGVDSLTSAFTDLVGHPQLSVGVGLLAVLLALLLGAFHAFAPGHGKTVMAAYLVAGRGSVRQVSLIGLAVTATHTLGVLVLGLVLSTFATFAPEKVYPWLGAASGLLLVSIGCSLLRNAWRRRELWTRPLPADHLVPHQHSHSHDHAHHGHEPPPEPAPLAIGPPTASAAATATAIRERPAPAVVHSHGGRTHSHAPISDEPVRLRSLLTLGLAGGLVPSPSALVVLVGAIALHRAWFGVVLVVCYGAGMALTLVGIGLLLSRLRGRFVNRIRPEGRFATALAALPLLTAALICVIGLALAARGLSQA
jgi:ABC-type nickel/cobalt efflux system permease component RcnA